ncbi:protein SERAC1-like isoform X3 [Ceratina calcarata]|uniref:Protein SERAC1 n=1 Tax=Ceratina calcarata TaxID=156304 RepID=A0AAJ7NBW9_9HYME|nr:protein SERAC1-like isoform X3 [Ceratina calcarata]
MGVRIYRKCIEYIKSTGICIVMVGGCWFLYQLREVSKILQYSVPTNILNIEQTQTQYIYVDDPRFKDILLYKNIGSLQSSVPVESFSFNNTILKWWKSLNRSIAYKLLTMAQIGDRTEKLRALYTLNSLKHLKDWHYRHIAQMLDAKTAVILARMPRVDTRFFLKPPYYYIHHKLHDVIEKVHQLLLYLNASCENTHPCLTQFLNKKFKDTPSDSLILDHDLTNLGLAVAPATVWDPDLLLNCIQALCHHSCSEQYSKDIVIAGGLPLLMLIKRMFNDNINVCILLAKTISNISLHSEHLDDIFQSGWIGTLVEWSQSKDIRLSAPASRALANLDIDENENVKYPRRIYLLHPLHKTRGKIKLDVVFLHGLLGGVFITWRQRDQDEPDVGIVGDSNSSDDACMQKIYYDKRYKTLCWPRDWLPEDIPSLRVIGVNYDTNLSMWTPSCPIEGARVTMYERSKEYVKKLLTAGVGQRPTIWVCHSMGGLLVKKMLVNEWKNGDKNDICKNTRGIVFYSTPHKGSHVAALKQATQMVVWPSIEVQELREGSPQLLELHNEFLTMLKEYPIDIVSFSETKSTHVTPLKVPFQFVTSNSADPGVGEFYEIAQDHLTICKPATRHSFLYQKLLNMLKRHVQTHEKTTVSSVMELFSLPSKLF